MYRSEYRQWRDELAGERPSQGWRLAGMAMQLASVVSVIWAAYAVGRHFGWWG